MSDKNQIQASEEYDADSIKIKENIARFMRSALSFTCLNYRPRGLYPSRSATTG